MLGYHYHEDENGNTYKCENVDCDVAKKRMEMYSQLAHKVWISYLKIDCVF